MKTRVKTERRVRIEQDEHAVDPREYDNAGKMYCWHRRYSLGDEQPDQSPDEICRELLQDWTGEFIPDELSGDELREKLEQNCVMLPLYLYDHSGLAMNTGGFSCPWDSGQVGFILISRPDAIDEWGEAWRERAEAVLRAEVEEYNRYLQGDVYRFIAEERDLPDGQWEVVDDIGGFYGSDPRTNGMTDHLEDGDLELLVASAE